MLIKNICCTLLLLISITFSVLAQRSDVSAVIYNEDAEPLAGASVHIPALKKNIVTDENGGFILNEIPFGKTRLFISATGYHTHTTTIHIDSSNHKFTFILKKNFAVLDDVAVLGYSSTQLANRQSYHVKAIDAAKLHNTSLDLAHLLDRVPGARLRETGGLGSDFDFSINGFSGKRIRFFMDGVPIDHFGPSFQINNIPINLASRVEVYKGVVPVWLGSDALGGAVNIITNNRLRNYLDISYAYGSFNTHRTSINAAVTSKNGFTFRANAFQHYSDNNYKVTVDAADIHTGKYYPNTIVKRFHDQYHNETVIVGVGLVDKKWADELLAGITLGQYYREMQTGARIVAVFGAWHTKGNIVMPTLKYQKQDLFTKGLNLTFNANYNAGEEQSIDTVHARYGWLGDSVNYRGKGGELWYSHYRYKNNIANATATATYNIGKYQHIALNNVFTHFNRKGYNAVEQNSVLDAIPRKADKNILGISYQYQALEKWEATIFGKYLHQRAATTLIETDMFNSGDTTYTDANTNRNKLGYGLAASYHINPVMQVKFSYEKTNRLPESEDIYGDVMNKEGNWNVKPESSNNFNLGIHYNLSVRNSRFFLSATGTYYQARDFIYYTFNSYTNKLKAENLLKVSNLGIETELRYAYKQLFTAGLNLTWQNIKDRQKYRQDLNTMVPVYSDTYKERIPNIPYFFGNADAALHLANVVNKDDKLTVGYNMLYVHAFYLYWANEGAKDTKRIIPQQLSHDVSLVYALKGGRYNIGFECRNITDQRLYDNFSLQKPGRSFTVKLRYFINHKNL